MTLKKRSRVAMALVSGAVAGFGTHLLANHRVEKRGGEDMLAPYEFGPHYLIDVAGGIACAGLTYCLTAAWNRYQAHRQEQVNFADANKHLTEQAEAQHQQDLRDYTAVAGPQPSPTPWLGKSSV